MIYCGIDWAERTHDIALVDDTGRVVAKRHITDEIAGYKIFLELLAEHGDTEDDPIPVAIETSRGLLVSVLRTGKRQVFAINPMAAARYRDRHSVSRKKSDPGDDLVLANILRTDMHAHRPLPDDTDLGRAIAVLARAQQDATWNRQQIANQLRSLLREYYPSALAAVEAWKNGLCRPEAREILRLAPTPSRSAKLTRTQLQAALKRASRKRGIDAEVERFREIFRAEWAHQPPLVEEALGKQMLALLTRSTRTPRSSLASRVSGSSSAPGCSQRSETIAPASPTPAALRPTRAPHPSPGPPAKSGDHQTVGEERPAQPCRLPVGVLRA